MSEVETYHAHDCLSPQHAFIVASDQSLRRGTPCLCGRVRVKQTMWNIKSGWYLVRLTRSHTHFEGVAP